MCYSSCKNLAQAGHVLLVLSNLISLSDLLYISGELQLVIYD